MLTSLKMLAMMREVMCDIFCNIPADSSLVEDYLSRSGIDEFMKKYEMFIQSVIGGELGPTAQFWSIYVYMINLCHRNLQRFN